MKILEKVFGRDETYQTRLELARHFADMGGLDLARDLLSEVIDEGSERQAKEARSLIATLH